jgi:hypothetical protein
MLAVFGVWADLSLPMYCRYDDEDRVRWPGFDFLSQDRGIGFFDPESDMSYSCATCGGEGASRGLTGSRAHCPFLCGPSLAPHPGAGTQRVRA